MLDDEPILSDNLRAAAQAEKNARAGRLLAEQAAMRARNRNNGGNPNLKKGERPYNVSPSTFQEWLTNNGDYTRKNKFSISEAVRMFMHEIPRKNNASCKRRVQLMLEALFNRACDETSPLQAQCASLLMDRAWGKAQAASADLDAIKKGGLTLVYVDRNQIDPEIPVLEEDRKSLPEPEFIDAEVIDGVQ